MNTDDHKTLEKEMFNLDKMPAQNITIAVYKDYGSISYDKKVVLDT